MEIRIGEVKIRIETNGEPVSIHFDDDNKSPEDFLEDIRRFKTERDLKEMAEASVDEDEEMSHFDSDGSEHAWQQVLSANEIRSKQKQERVVLAKKLQRKGKTTQEIAKELNLSEASIYGYLRNG